ncbi:hypothetical protein UCH007_02060 [Dehalococcoides sp. UCH007]|nr:hypothetical protein UCH007_02060 [Dehalococcoides sp. UCH007]
MQLSSLFWVSIIVILYGLYFLIFRKKELNQGKITDRASVYMLIAAGIVGLIFSFIP